MARKKKKEEKTREFALIDIVGRYSIIGSHS